MRHSLLFAILVSGLLLVSPPVTQAQPEGDTVTDPDAVVYVDGLACPFCAYGLEKKLDRLDAIEAMEVPIEESRIRDALKRLAAACDGSGGPTSDCPILDAMAGDKALDDVPS